jgi:hypothetical protein
MTINRNSSWQLGYIRPDQRDYIYRLESSNTIPPMLKLCAKLNIKQYSDRWHKWLNQPTKSEKRQMSAKDGA